MNKSKFIVGDEYIYQKGSAPLAYVGESKHNGVGLFESDSGSVYHYEYENMTPCTKAEPQYPNPPLQHCEERIAHAKGANIEGQHTNNVTWWADPDPQWHKNIKYRVKVEKTKDDSLIERLERRIRVNENANIKYKEEIAKLKPTVHY